tara:strand:+ start:1466 stop:1774 length:309 start_codon:yes stop_codon:yes gene_type:complete
MQINISLYEETLNIILYYENKVTKKEKIENLKSKKVIKLIEKSVKIYKETNAMLRWNLIKKEIHEIQEEKNNVINKLMTVIQLYVDKESHEKTKKKGTKLLF